MKNDSLVTQSGAPLGTLIAVGGGRNIEDLLKLLVEKAGGADAPIVVIPTAGGGPEYPPDWSGQRELLEAGARNVTVVHTYDSKVADSSAFVQPLREAKGVWITGGRQWHLADAYLNTQVHDALWDVYQRGGVVGGSSAGATILGSYLARGDTKSNVIMMGDHEVGFGFLKDVAVDQHVLVRNRHFDLLEIIRAKPHLLGIGLDEDTAIIVHGDALEVAGKSYVTIYDAGRSIDSGGEFYFMTAGDRLDLKTRKPTRGRDPLERVISSNDHADQVEALLRLEEEYHIYGYDPNTPLYTDLDPAAVGASARLLDALGEIDIARDHFRTKDLVVELDGRYDDQLNLPEADVESLKRIAQWYLDLDHDGLRARIDALAGKVSRELRQPPSTSA